MFTELKKKENKIWNFLQNKKSDGLLLSKRDNFAWISCGGVSGVEKCVQDGVVDLLFLDGRKYIIASTIEKFRFLVEEISGKDFQLIDYEWFDGSKYALKHLISGKKIISDSGAFGTLEAYDDIKRLRYTLEDEEIARLMEVSSLTAKAMGEVCSEIEPGVTEFDIAANLNYKLIKCGAEVPVCLIATDDRIQKFRHPVPKNKRVEKCAMLVIGAEKYGLVVSMTRLVYFGKPEEDLLERHKACLTVDAAFIENTVIGTKACDIFKTGVEAYRKCGYPDEWKLHHQGGAAGYRSRDYVANFLCEEVVQANQMFSWNPTISGTKSEDTLLVTPDGPKVITEIDGWPTVDIEINGRTVKRPGILVR